MGDLSGKVAIVTGGNGGIGAAIAAVLAEAGASVAVAARNPEKNREIESRLRAGGADCLALQVDVQREEQIRDCVVAVEARCRAYARVGGEDGA